MTIRNSNPVEETRAVLSETAKQLEDTRLRARQNKCSHKSYVFGHAQPTDCSKCAAGFCSARKCSDCGKEL